MRMNLDEHHFKEHIFHCISITCTAHLKRLSCITGKLPLMTVCVTSWTMLGQTWLGHEYSATVMSWWRKSWDVCCRL